MLLLPAAEVVHRGLRPVLLARLPVVPLQLRFGPFSQGAVLFRLLGGSRWLFALLPVLMPLFPLSLSLPPWKMKKTLSLTGLSPTLFVTLPLLRLFSARSLSTLNLLT